MMAKYNKLQNIYKAYVQYGAKFRSSKTCAYWHCSLHMQVETQLPLQNCTTTWTVYWTLVQSGWFVPTVHMKPKFRIREIIHTSFTYFHYISS